MRPLQALFLAAPLLIIGACGGGGTSLTSVWSDPDLGDVTLHNIMVIGVSEEANIRRRYEDDMISAMEQRGIDGAIPSYSVLPKDEQLEREEIEAIVEENGIDGLLLTRQISVDEKTEYTPGYTTYAYPTYYGGFYPYYGYAYGAAHTPGYVTQYDVVTLETSLYRVEDEALLWSARSETTDPTSAQEAIAQITQSLAKEMARSGLAQ